MQQPIKHIAIFASGAGSNAQKIIERLNPLTPNPSPQVERGAEEEMAAKEKEAVRKQELAKVVLILCNNPAAGVLKIAEKENIASIIIERKKFYDDGYLAELKKYHIDLIVLAGFLWKVPEDIIRSYQNKIINIHPALLPKFGGKNMYGNFVHEAVIKSGEKESGITIHYVDEIYDHGKIIFQAKCKVDENDTPQTLAEKIHALEHKHYPLIIERIIA
jgi:phosphoribosylglycinamide formyltransferase-1